jgi:hypothetical protein
VVLDQIKVLASNLYLGVAPVVAADQVQKAPTAFGATWKVIRKGKLCLTMVFAYAVAKVTKVYAGSKMYAAKNMPRKGTWLQSVSKQRNSLKS